MGAARFYFYCSGDHPDLHSFPTRRSSDLGNASTTLTVTTSATLSRYGLLMPDLIGIRRRSEEHTSELQSRRDLVCRLLLEKKDRDGHTQHLPADVQSRCAHPRRRFCRADA